MGHYNTKLNNANELKNAYLELLKSGEAKEPWSYDDGVPTEHDEGKIVSGTLSGSVIYNSSLISNIMSSSIVAEPIIPTINFKGIHDLEIMRLEPNGDIYVKGVLVENDKEVVDALRLFLKL